MKKQVFIAVLVFIFSVQLNAQDNVRIPLLGEEAPTFTAQSTNGEIIFPDDFGNKWKILFSHPKDFTPVCSSELLELAYQQDDYKDIGAQILVLSTDIVSQHKTWISALEKIKYKNRDPVKIKFPLIDDSNYIISEKYGMIHPDEDPGRNVRAVFIIDPENKIRLINFYPNNVGRNLDEIRRTVVALQTIDSRDRDVAPANWRPGDQLMVPFLTEEEEKKLGSQESDIRQVSWFMNFRNK